MLLTSTLTFPLPRQSPSFPRAAAVLPVSPGSAQLLSFLPDLLRAFQVEWFTSCPRLHLYSHLQFHLSCLLLWEVPVPVIGTWVPIEKELCQCYLHSKWSEIIRPDEMNSVGDWWAHDTSTSHISRDFLHKRENTEQEKELVFLANINFILFDIVIQ